VSLFSYEARRWLSRRGLREAADAVWIVAPEGMRARLLEAGFESATSSAAPTWKLFVVPFLPQDRYDELLWACDVIFAARILRARAVGPALRVAHLSAEGRRALDQAGGFLDRYSRAGPVPRRPCASLWKRGTGGEVSDCRDLRGAVAFSSSTARALPARGLGGRLQMQPELAGLAKFASNLLK
jgi:hypothetical protein